MRNKNNQGTDSPYSLANTIVVTSILSLVTAAFLLTISAIVLSIFGMYRFSALLESAGLSLPQLASQVSVGARQQPKTDTQGHSNFLLLGLDAVGNRTGSKPLTDTMLLISLDTKSNTVYLLSIPRDLWHQSTQSRVNALYAIAQERNLDPTTFVTAEIEQLTQLEIHHTLTVTLDSVAELVDSLGGVEVEVDTAFTDSLYPRSDVDITTETDPAVLYETVSFSEGKQILSGQQALQYARSRHAVGPEGTDLARAARQQKLVAAIAQALLSPEQLTQSDTIQKLLTLYATQYQKDLTITELTAQLVQAIRVDQPLKFVRSSLPIYPDDPNGVLYHPPEYQYQGQWVYALRNPDEFSKTIYQLLGY